MPGCAGPSPDASPTAEHLHQPCPLAPWQHLAAGSLFLAGKVEECPRKVRLAPAPSEPRAPTHAGSTLPRSPPCCRGHGLRRRLRACSASLARPSAQVRDVLNIFNHLEQKRAGATSFAVLDIYSQKYTTLKERLIRAEREILKELGFVLYTEHPHKFILNYCK